MLDGVEEEIKRRRLSLKLASFFTENSKEFELVLYLPE